MADSLGGGGGGDVVFFLHLILGSWEKMGFITTEPDIRQMVWGGGGGRRMEWRVLLQTVSARHIA